MMHQTLSKRPLWSSHPHCWALIKAMLLVLLLLLLLLLLCCPGAYQAQHNDVMALTCAARPSWHL